MGEQILGSLVAIGGTIIGGLVIGAVCIALPFYWYDRRQHRDDPEPARLLTDD